MTINFIHVFLFPLIGSIIYFIASARDHFGPGFRPGILWNDWKWVMIASYFVSALLVMVSQFEPSFYDLLRLTGIDVLENAGPVTLSILVAKFVKEGTKEKKHTTVNNDNTSAKVKHNGQGE